MTVQSQLCNVSKIKRNACLGYEVINEINNSCSRTTNNFIWLIYYVITNAPHQTTLSRGLSTQLATE